MTKIFFNGVSLGELKLNKGAKLESVVWALKKKLRDKKKITDVKKSVEKRSKYIDLKEITESEDKKNIVFSFKNNTKFYYSLLEKKFTELDGGIRKVELVKGNRVGDLNFQENCDNFFKQIIENSKVTWIRKFFEFSKIATCYRRPPVFLTSKVQATKLEILSKIEAFQKLNNLEEVLPRLINNKKFKTCLDDVGLDNWFLEQSDKDPIIWEYLDEYLESKKSKDIENFRYYWNNYNFPHHVDFLKRASKTLIPNGYDPKKLMEYLTKDVVHQGLRPIIERTSLEDFENFEKYGYTYDEINDFDIVTDNNSLCYCMQSFNLLERYVDLQEDKNYEKYPKNLKTMIDISLYKRMANQSKILENKYKQVYGDLENFEFKDEKYCVIRPKNIRSIIEEGISLHHCVGNYAKDAALGKCKIIFLRNISFIEKPLITLQIGGKAKYHIVNACGLQNRNPSLEEEHFLNKYKVYLKTI